MLEKKDRPFGRSHEGASGQTLKHKLQSQRHLTNASAKLRCVLKRGAFRLGVSTAGCGRRDAACVEHIAVRQRIAGMVENVENFRTDLQIFALPEISVFEERDVEGGKTGRAVTVAPDVRLDGACSDDVAVVRIGRNVAD